MFVLVEPPSRLALPLLLAPRPVAGFPSPAADYVEGKLDLNERLIPRPAATFIVTITGDSMQHAGIYNGDLAVVDRSIKARSGHIVVAALDGELVVKRLRIRKGTTWLESESDDDRYRPIAVAEGSSFEIWGVVKHTIRNHLA